MTLQEKIKDLLPNRKDTNGNVVILGYNQAIFEVEALIPEILKLVGEEIKQIAFGTDLRGRNWVDIEDIKKLLKI